MKIHTLTVTKEDWEKIESIIKSSLDSRSVSNQLDKFLFDTYGDQSSTIQYLALKGYKLIHFLSYDWLNSRTFYYNATYSYSNPERDEILKILVDG